MKYIQQVQVNGWVKEKQRDDFRVVEFAGLVKGSVFEWEVLPIHIKVGSVQNQTTNVAVVVFKVAEDAITHLEGRKEGRKEMD